MLTSNLIAKRFDFFSDDYTTEYAYDNNGNLISRQSKADAAHLELGWDSENRLISLDVYDSTGTLENAIEYGYDALSRRVFKKINGNLSAQYSYQGQELVAQHNNFNLTHTFTTHPQVLDLHLDMELNGQLYQFLKDGLGSITELVDQNGNVVEYYAYDSFGQQRIFDQSGNEIQSSNFQNPYGFTGRESDEESPLYYYRARYYSPEAGRFISEDPIGFGGGDTNIYRYVENNSINSTDPEGLFGAFIFKKILNKLIEKFIGKEIFPPLSDPDDPIGPDTPELPPGPTPPDCDPTKQSCGPPIIPVKPPPVNSCPSA